MKYLKKEEVGQRGQKFSFYPFKIRCTQELTLLNFFFPTQLQQGEKSQD